MPKFTVHFMTPFVTWEGVEADSADEAIAKVGTPAEYDANEPFTFVASEEITVKMESAEEFITKLTGGLFNPK